MGLFGFFRKKNTMTLGEVVKEMKRKGYSDKQIKEQLLPRATEQVLGGLDVPKERIEELVEDTDSPAESVWSDVDYTWVLGKCGGDWKEFLEAEGIEIIDEDYCPDCKERDGRKETMEFWETIGLPRSGFSVCQEECGCSLERVEP